LASGGGLGCGQTTQVEEETPLGQMVPFVALLVVPNWIPVNLKVLFQQQKIPSKKR